MKCRVSVVQFGTGTDVSANLGTCLRMIDESAKSSPDFIVLPEFSNHCAIYESLEYADEVAVELSGEFLSEIAARAKEHCTYIKINVTLKKLGDKPTVSNLLYSPEGKLAGRADKQVLMGNENNFCSRAETAGDVVDTEFGKVGMYACADGLLMETTRLLALRGAKLLLNSLNSFAEDEASLHIPVRAAENRVFVAAACKVDYLVPKHILATFAEKMKIAPEALKGAGESQIVAPDGTVLAKANRTEADIVFADIDLDHANPEVFLKDRRPRLYAPIGSKPEQRKYAPGDKVVKTAICQSIGDIIKTDAKLIVLPELTEGVEQISELLSDNFVVTSVREGNAHVGVLIGKEGVLFKQKQIHRSAVHDWIIDLGDGLETFDLPFGRLAIIVGEDSRYPEIFRLAAYQNAEIIAAPFNVRERWETEFGLFERSVENRVSVVAATRPKKDLGKYGHSLITTIGEDFTLWTEWKNRPFDGNINYPIVARGNSDEPVFEADVYPANSGNRLVSQGTDVVDGRAWWLLGPLAT